MYLHLGQSTTIKTGDVIGLFDLETASIGKHTRNYLAAAQKGGQVVNTSQELPKSFVVVTGKKKSTVYISQMATATLNKRLKASRRGSY